jgi:uncharacterized glyoxalase superfamily protein PhnB/predicted enzyme related to lactoylglutathione lyase
VIVNRSAPNGTIVPSLIYNDIAKAVEWLCDVFGFTERLLVTGPDGKVAHAQVAMGLGGILLGAARSDGRWDFRPPRPNEVSQSLSVHVPDIDRHYEQTKQRGARILLPLRTHVYGERQYTAEDLEGYRWTFTQAVADVKPEEWGATPHDLSGPLTLLPRPRFCYIEIPAKDLQQSVAFYEQVFGWNIRHRDTGRPSFDDATGYISGAWVAGRAPSREPGLLPYIWVDGIEAILAKVAGAGGEVVESTHLDSPGGEHIATFRDPAGNLFGLYEESPH